MRRSLLLSAAMLTGLTAAAVAQQPAAGIKLSDVAGVWDSKTMMGPKDSVVITIVITATADAKGWTMTNGKNVVPVRVVSSGGDSIVTEAGPYPSYLRPGATVTLLRTVGHYKGNEMWGSFTATYATGDKISGKVSAMRRK
ncbi:MAG TPA: hypothetical protein VMH88_15850 [Gemmatimonadales bacterium]|nr:hypothetical protein [Gemmatimonadales bacterium]